MNERILIIGPAWVGDMVMAQSLFRLLHERNPKAILDVLAPAWSLPLLARMPEVSEAIALPIQHRELKLTYRYHLAKSLRSKHYARSIVLPNSFKSALIPFWAHISKRTGYRGEMRYFILNDLRHLNKKKYPLMVERFLALGLAPNEALPKTFPIPALSISFETRDQALDKFNLSIKNQKILALCPGAEFGPAKRWPEKYYADIARFYANKGFQIWLFGSEKDRKETEKIHSLSNVSCVNLAGKTQLAEAIDLLSCAEAVVSNDSGLMHIAAALNKPLVAVYGPTSPGFTPPLHTASKIIQHALSCQPCFKRVCPLKHHHCMEKLFPSQVIEALQEIGLS